MYFIIFTILTGLLLCFFEGTVVENQGGKIRNEGWGGEGECMGEECMNKFISSKDMSLFCYWFNCQQNLAMEYNLVRFSSTGEHLAKVLHCTFFFLLMYLQLLSRPNKFISRISKKKQFVTEKQQEWIRLMRRWLNKIIHYENGWNSI